MRLCRCATVVFLGFEDFTEICVLKLSCITGLYGIPNLAISLLTISMSKCGSGGDELPKVLNSSR